MNALAVRMPASISSIACAASRPRSTWSTCGLVRKATSRSVSSTMRCETLACRSSVAITGTAPPTARRTAANITPSGSNSPVALAAPCCEMKTPSSGPAASRRSTISATTASKNAWSAGPLAPAPVSRIGTGSQSASASIASTKPWTVPEPREAGDRISASRSSPARYSFSRNSASAATGAKPLVSSMKPRIAMRPRRFRHGVAHTWVSRKRATAANTAIRFSQLVEPVPLVGKGHVLHRHVALAQAVDDQFALIGRHPRIIQPVGHEHRHPRSGRHG